MAVSLQQQVREGLIAVINAFNNLLAKMQPATVNVHMQGYLGICWASTNPAEVGFRVSVPDGTLYSSATISPRTVSIVDCISNTWHPNITVNSITIDRKQPGGLLLKIKFNTALTNNHLYRFYGTIPTVTLS